jgi:hypothetical protein
LIFQSKTETTMGCLMVMSACIACKRLFSYNANLVPSIRVNADGDPDPAGHREPVCRACMDRANAKRVANGLEPLHILPGAYEPMDETNYE